MLSNVFLVFEAYDLTCFGRLDRGLIYPKLLEQLNELPATFATIGCSEIMTEIDNSTVT